MRPSLISLVRPRRLPRNVSPIMPPLALYRRILRAHIKHLDPDMRALGDDYVKSEFRLHKNIDNPLHIIGFLTTWQKYADTIEGENWKEQKLDMEQISKMSEDQIIQLYELMKSTKGEEDIDPKLQNLVDQAVKS